MIIGAELTVRFAVDVIQPPGTGFCASIVLIPVEDISTAEIVAWTCELFINVVVLFEPLKRTTVELLKFVPFTVKVNEEPPFVTQFGEILAKVGTGLFTENKLLIPFSEPLVRVAVIVKFPGFEIVIPVEDNIPAANEADVPPPAVRVPVDVILTVPVKTFGPLLHVLLFISRAVTLILKLLPTFCDPIFPPADDSTRKLFSTPGFTVNVLLVPFCTPPVVRVAVILKFPILENVTLLDASTPATKAGVVPLPEVNVPDDVISTVPV